MAGDRHEAADKRCGEDRLIGKYGSNIPTRPSYRFGHTYMNKTEKSGAMPLFNRRKRGRGVYKKKTCNISTYFLHFCFKILVGYISEKNRLKTLLIKKLTLKSHYFIPLILILNCYDKEQIGWLIYPFQKAYKCNFRSDTVDAML